MSLLDSFVLLFEADTGKAIREINALAAANDATGGAVDDARKALDKQIAALELQAATAGMSRGEAILYKMAQEGATTADIERARAALEAAGAMEEEQDAVTSLTQKLVGFAAATFGISAILGKVFERTETIRGIQQTSDALGIAIEDVDAFGRAAQAMGGDAEGARDSLVDMAEAMGEALSDPESGKAEAFKKLGINIKDTTGKAKDALSGMLALAESVEGLSKSEAIFKIKEVGITDNRQVEMILKGRKELERMLDAQKEQSTVTKESAENARKLTEAMAGLKTSAENAGAGLIDAIIPAVTKVVEWLAKGFAWMMEHKDFVVGFFSAIAVVVGTLYLPSMVAAAAATLAATWPLIAIGAALAAAAAAFALIYDDIMNFIDGNDSFIGQVSEKYPIVGQAVLGLIQIFKDMWSVLVTGAQQIGTFFVNAFSQILSGIKAVIDFIPEAIAQFEGLVTRITEMFAGMGEAVKAIFDGIVDAIRGALDFASKGIDKFKSGVSGVASFFGIGDDEADASQPGEASQQSTSQIPSINRTMAEANEQLGAARQSPANSITSNAISNQVNRTSQTDVQINEVIVQTQATDAQGISKDIGSSLGDQLKGLEAESATGVDR